MTKRQKEKYSALSTLQGHNVNAQKHNQIRFNSGSETIPHAIGKLLVGYIGQVNGYWVSSEVEVPQGSIDVLLWGHPERMNLAVEIETAPTQETIDSKLERYVKQIEPIDDIVIINTNDIPMHMLEAADFIAQELGLTV